MKLPELLAPAGNINHLKLAVYNGASAVYLSGLNFGARKYAKNFNIDEIRESVNFAHLYNVKVYVTVNILIKESEIDDVVKYVIELYKIGVDALLVQDIGLIKIIHNILPNFPIHASTQLNINNIKGVDWAKENGIKRIVLARELKFNEVKEITDYAHKNNIEVEIFVHGALCYSYSGHCLLSSCIGGRSGNRGACAQPCRQKYTLCCENGQSLDENFIIPVNKSYLLSPKDLSLYSSLNKILFVDSLKIEGRMRNEDYVSTVVYTYRQALNKLKHNKKIDDNEDLNLVFNRQFTRGHLFDNPNKIINYKKPSNNGLFIGNVINFNGKSVIQIELSSRTIPEKGDGILIEGKSLTDDTTANYGFELSVDPKIENNILTIKTIRENKNINIKIDNDSKVYISKRNKIVNKTKQVLKGKNHSYKKSILDIDFKVKNKYPYIKASVKLGNGKIIKYKYKSKIQWEEAKNKPITREQINENLRKTNNLPFFINYINITYMENLFTPMSNLNKIRRDFYDNLVEKILDSYSRDDLKYVKANYKKFKSDYYKEDYEVNPVNKISNLSVYINSLDQLKEINKNPVYKRVYIEIPKKERNILSANYNEKFNLNYCINFLKEASKIKTDDYELVWKWPDIADNEILNNLFKIHSIIYKYGLNPDIMTSLVGVYEVLEKYGINIYGSQYFNVFNSQTLGSLDKFDLLTISPELSKEDIKNIISHTNKDLEIIVGGNLETMITKKPILRKKDIKNIRKQLNIKITKETDLDVSIKNIKNEYYPVKGTVSQELIVLFNKKLSLISKLNELKSYGFNNFAIDLRWENPKNINAISSIFNKGLSSTDSELKSLDDNLNDYWFEKTTLNYDREII